jgi:hypothetical protein
MSRRPPLPRLSPAEERAMQRAEAIIGELVRQRVSREEIAYTGILLASGVVQSVLAMLGGHSSLRRVEDAREQLEDVLDDWQQKGLLAPEAIHVLLGVAGAIALGLMDREEPAEVRH